MSPDTPAWSVLLIGGSSGAGKTVLARELARHFSTSLLFVDDIRLALQEATTPAQQPSLHAFLNYSAEQWRNPDSICADWIAVGQAMIPSLKVILAHHVVVTGVGRVIIEGDGILPVLAAQRDFSELKHFWGLRTEHEVRAVFIVEPDETQILRNLRARGRGFDEMGSEEQHVIARASWLFGQWIQQEARAYGQPALLARPYETLLQRVLASL